MAKRILGKKDHYSIRTMTREDFGIAIDWAMKEGWNPGIHDFQAFYAADPDGFLIGYLGDEPISTISAVRYGEYGFIGFYIVKEKYRGMGYGIQIWERALNSLDVDGMIIGLDGVPAQQSAYERSGFRKAYRNIRYEFYLEKMENLDLPPMDEDEQLVNLWQNFPDDIVDYDSRHFFAPRPDFLYQWFLPMTTVIYAFMRKGIVAGYGVVRTCVRGYKIGPLFADDEKTARHILKGLTKGLPEFLPVYLDVPEINKSAMRIASECDMKPMFETIRMYSGGKPDLPLDHWFGVTSFELG